MPFAVALANGSLALEAILRACGIGPGDEVIVTPRSFIASASCVDLVGAKPVFADIDIDSEAIAPATVSPLITRRTKAIIVVHLNGRPADMPGFMELAGRHNIFVFEDCAQAHGARIDGKLVGSFGHASAFSFCQDKIISTGGEGGMVLFRDESHWRRAWSYRDHGKDYDLVFNPSSSPGFRWLHTSFGSNWRLTEIQAAIGLRQLAKLPKWTAARTANARKLEQWLTTLSVRACRSAARELSACLLPLQFPRRADAAEGGLESRSGDTRAHCGGDTLPVRGMSRNLSRRHLCAVHGGLSAFPQRRVFGTVSLGLLVHPTLDESFLQDCRVALEKVFDAATN